jgi:hypothetical protein
MKKQFFLLSAAIALGALTALAQTTASAQTTLPAQTTASAPATAPARSLEITVADVRNDKGNILVMAKIAGVEQPVLASATATPGKVTVTLDVADAHTVEISLFHDEDANYEMAMGERGPTEGYALKKVKLGGEKTLVDVRIYYPTQE